MTAFGIGVLAVLFYVWGVIIVIGISNMIDTQKRRRKQLIGSCECMYGLGRSDYIQDRIEHSYNKQDKPLKNKPLKKRYANNLHLMTRKEKAIASCLQKVYEQGYKDAFNDSPRRPEILITKELRGVIKWKIITIHDVLVFM